MDADQKARVEQDRRELFSLATQNIKWVLASLLLVNGAALAALLNGADKLPPTALSGARDFSSGLVAALAAGGLAVFSAFGAAGRLDAELREKQSLANLGCLAQLSSGAMAFVFLVSSVAFFAHGVITVGEALGMDRPSVETKKAGQSPDAGKPTGRPTAPAVPPAG